MGGIFYQMQKVKDANKAYSVKFKDIKKLKEFEKSEAKNNKKD